jgi:acyl-CoA thioester hydrolase
MPEPLLSRPVVIRPEWIDYNGHMNEGYYIVVFSEANDTVYDLIGLDAVGRARMGRSIFTAETHIAYLSEARLGEEVQVATTLLSHDVKRLHLLHAMRRMADGTLLSTAEMMVLHVDTSTRHVVPFAPEVLERVRALAAEHASLPVPPQVGRAIRRLSEPLQRW